MKIGFIGLGNMGQAIVANILRAGHQVTVWNRSPGPVAALAALGAVVAKAPAETLQGDAVFSMLANDAALAEVGLTGAVLDKAASGLVHVNMATISTALARQLTEAHRARGLGYVAAPVFGRPDAAAAAKLIVIAAGAEKDVARVQPVLEVIGRRVAVVGQVPEQANLFKIAGNFMLAAAIETLGEAIALVRKGGIDPAIFHEVLTSSLFAAPVYQGYGALIVAQKYEPPGFKLRLGMKDAGLALAAGNELQVPLPLASLVHDHFIEAMVAGLGEKDWAALACVAAAKAGLSPA
ncbi:MAG: NAD(P)-dependent oxidoreductase [Alphaproteobacteria bacterium]|nr:NAD(P)-dependent oxidoreductase [Alphaproteobacteria bacterium]MDE2500737.1 NAD(P)-dependent oxidoreductase [Alphaproteobacteria bacterium]